MANTWYPKGLEGFGNAAINWPADTIKVTLVDTADYTYNAAHDFIDDVPAAARVATATLSGKTNVNGVLDANDVTFSAVSGDQSEALIIWKDTGSETTSRLLMYFDTATGLPVLPNTGDITITWDVAGIGTL